MIGNDSHARRSNGPRRRANHAKINWTKRDTGPSPARKAQIARFDEALESGGFIELARLLEEELED